MRAPVCVFITVFLHISLSVCSHSAQSTEENGFNDPSLLENLQSNHVSTVMASQLLSHAQPARNLLTGPDIHTLTPPVFPQGSFLAHISSVLPTRLFMNSLQSQNLFSNDMTLLPVFLYKNKTPYAGTQE